MEFEDKGPAEFDNPQALPSENKEIDWQKRNKAWWEKNPMRYDWKDKITYKEFSKEFFTEIDRRFFRDSIDYSPFLHKPFESLIDFDSLKNKNVLEIGIGNGSHAQLLSEFSKSFTGIDITDYAVESTSKRFDLFGLKGFIRRMDAEKMEFPDRNFDFVWSWGVIHHSANTDNILKEIKRVLRPDGQAVIMVYHRGWWNYYVRTFLKGTMSGQLFKTKSIHKTAQALTDGAIARYYSEKEWKNKLSGLFVVKNIFTIGPKSDWLLVPPGRFKKFLIKIIPSKLNILLTKYFKMGTFLITEVINTNE